MGLPASTPPPEKFKSRLFGQDTLLNTIRDSYDNLPHLFITGPPGSGKTTILEDLIEMFKLEAPFHIDSVLWLSSEKDRGIHTIRDKVNDFCKRIHSKPNCLRWIVVDDTDTLPLISQQALRRPMETYSHLTRFLFASRHASHMIEPLRSRCMMLELEPMGPIDAYPMYLDIYNIPTEARIPGLFNFCIRNFIIINDIKSIIKLYKASVTDGKSPKEALASLECLLSTSNTHIQTLVNELGQKNAPEIREAITNLYLNG